ncbi:MAG: hypothetical protein PVI57_10295, partial [Gemmatimonadota bacterium]
MKTRVLAALAAAVLATTTACAPDAPEETGTTEAMETAGGAASHITSDGIMADVRVLSADSMEGRSPGTPGEERAVRYIARRFRDIGLEPVGDDYALPVELVGMTKRADASSLSIDGPDGALGLQDDVSFTYWSTAEEPSLDLTDAPLVFVGYGVQ